MNYIVFVFIILLAIVLHEFGHFIAAKLFKVEVDSFNIGMGKKITGFNKNGTEWNLRLLPIGGSCAINDDSFEKISPWKQIIIFAAGPFVNLALMVVSVAILYLISGSFNIMNVFSTVWNGIVAVLTSLVSVFDVVFNFSQSTLQENFVVADQVLGAATNGMEYIYQFCTLNFALNTALFVFNILPIPALDGGQIFMNIPAAIGKPINKNLVQKINVGFYCFLMGLTVFVLVKDIVVGLII